MARRRKVSDLVHIAIKRELDCSSGFTLGKSGSFIPHLDLASPGCTRTRKRRKCLARAAPSVPIPSRRPLTPLTNPVMFSTFLAIPAVMQPR
ncbi:hypothetical protein E2C01_097833 [Portunus trituberculatus]|uniref:Uncharacterized protein n=1 Tax=Portunus trituberculatus TaxID=210409 RepID=A0A5B7JZN4_PORTR|nr:hypothetical protein [Portunus trituberculatus]